MAVVAVVVGAWTGFSISGSGLPGMTILGISGAGSASVVLLPLLLVVVTTVGARLVVTGA